MVILPLALLFSSLTRISLGFCKPIVTYQHLEERLLVPDGYKYKAVDAPNSNSLQAVRIPEPVISSVKILLGMIKRSTRN
ncbi:hypothetical protein BD779DRAFT_258916 [Infundibulicybe gibba]|nr:hypothetical protein BD779DRAFT_258916 [Infundibulicybe gibba]